MILNFKYNKDIVYKLHESFVKAKWQGDHWTAEDCKRNYNNLQYFFTDNDPFQRWLTDLPVSVPSNRFTTLWEHQKLMQRHVHARKQCIIAGEPRTGKTLPILDYIESFATGDTWWVAPASALRGLELEIKKWKINVKNFYLLSYNAMRKYSSLPPPQFLIFDEAHKLKDPSRQTFNSALQLCEKQNDETDYRILLSGTPAPHSPSDWWALAEIAVPGWYKESNIFGFKKRLGYIDPSVRYVRVLSWKVDEVRKLVNLNKGLVEVILKKNCLDLPPSETQIVKVGLNKTQIKLYNILTKTETKAIVLLNKIRQLSDGFLYQTIYNERTGVEEKTVEFIGSNKYKQLTLDLEELEDFKRAVIYCAFTETVDQVTQVCLKSGWSVLQIDGRGWKIFSSKLPKGITPNELLAQMDASTENQLDINICVVAQADSASTGVEFSAAPTMIYFSNSDNGANKMQSLERNMSANSKHSVTYKEYVAFEVDEKILNRLENKQTLQSITLTEILQGELDEVKDINACD